MKRYDQINIAHISPYCRHLQSFFFLKMPLELEVAPRYTLLTLLTLFSLFTVDTVDRVYTIDTIGIVLKGILFIFTL